MVFALICSLIPLSVTAEVITISFEAVTDFWGVPWLVKQCMGLETYEDNTLTGLFIYSTLDEYGNPVTDLTPNDESRFYTQFTTAPNSLIVEVGDVSVKTDPDNVDIAIDFVDSAINEGKDNYHVTSWNFLPIISECPDMSVDFVSIYIEDSDGDAITVPHPVGIPTTAPVLEDWVGFKDLHIMFDWGDLSAEVTSIERVYLVDDILEALATLVENNPLDPEQETGLHQKIASAITKFDSDKVEQGCQQLSAFICQLEALLPMFEQTDDYGLANAILDTASEIFVDQCSVLNFHIECPKEDWLND